MTSDSQFPKDLQPAIEALLQTCMLEDRQQLQQQWQRLTDRQRRGLPVTRDLDRLQDKLQKSVAVASQRQSLVPAILYPDNLPVAERREEIAEAISAHQVVVIAGETGSGKTTQLPKICLELGRGVRGLIGHTQPRRIAARTVANRIAEELQTSLGDLVGYQVRFHDHSGDNSLVKLMTDGILLAEIQRDRFLQRYDTLIIDEAHERSLNIDFLLGYIKQILPKRPDLKVIVTSATIDLERFSQHFTDAPVIQVSGRTYPVAIRYRPLAEQDDDSYGAVVGAVEELLSLPQRGDILVFLSGEREIREAANVLRRANLRDLDILPLYARLSLADQARVFHPHKGVRVVLATNVAETSITVPGIRFVIDTGLARISRYSYRTKVQRLPVEPVSQASASQRAGRCGRLADGVCIRLYSEEDFNNRPAFTDPEIVRTNLAAVILRMLHLRIGDVRDFPFVDAPDRRLINDGYNLLAELGAVDAKNHLTDLGRQLSRLPVDPRLGRMLLAAERNGSLREVLVIVAALSLQDPRERPAEHRQAADEKHRQWRDQESDFLSLLNLWQHFEQKRQELSGNQFSKYCHQQFVSYLRMREWRDLHHQLHLSCRELGLRTGQLAADYAAIHRALLSGFLSQVGVRQPDREYQGTRNRKFYIFPGSGLFKKSPAWIMAAELLETSRLYAHNVARIEVDWLPELAAHLVRKSHSEPHYDVRRGQVMAYERQTLYGLPIVERKRVGYAKIDPVTAREVFIRSALVENQYRGKGDFATRNQALLASIQDLEDRLRRRDLLVDDQAIFAFYDALLPESIISLAAFEAWRKKAEAQQPDLLAMTESDLVAIALPGDEEEQFPRQLSWDGVNYRLDYRFEPGHPEDGVSVDVPVEILQQVPGWRFQWLVPGLLRDKCIALVKALPKTWRRQLVPVPVTVEKALAGVRPENRPLTAALADRIKRHSGLDIPADAWNEATLEPFYLMNYRIVGDGGHVIEQGRDLQELQRRYRRKVQQTIADAADDNQERAGISRWDFGELLPRSTVKKGELTIDVYPCLEDRGDSVALQLCDSAEIAAVRSRRGLVRLLMLQHPQPAKFLDKQLLRGKELHLAAAGLGARTPLVEDISMTAYRRACLGDNDDVAEGIPRTESEFLACLARGKNQIVSLGNDMERGLLDLIPLIVDLKKQLVTREEQFPEAVDEGRQQLAHLFQAGFFWQTSPDWWRQYPRYIKAAIARFEKLPGQVSRDRAISGEIAGFEQRLQGLRQSDRFYSSGVYLKLTEALFMLEEYRVSVYAQQLRTLFPISAKRLEAHWRKLETALDS